MSTPRRRLAAVFFVPRDWPDDALLAAAGCSNRLDPNADGVIDCRWTGMAAEAMVRVHEDHRIVRVTFWHSDLLARMSDDADLERDESMTVADSFAGACDALGASAAYLLTHPDQASWEWTLDREWAVIALEPNTLLDARPGLLYLSADLDRHRTPDPLRDDRDVLDADGGRLYFAGRGVDRWF